MWVDLRAARLAPPGAGLVAEALCPKPPLDGFALGDEALFVELCAGSASLSAELRRCGFLVLPIDCKCNRHVQATKVFELDLMCKFSWEFLDHVKSRACRGVAFWLTMRPRAAALGTSHSPRLNGGHHPRDAHHPLGLPGMDERRRQAQGRRLPTAYMSEPADSQKAL